MKVFVILDGVADRPCSDLGDMTPLEAAKTKNLDILTKSGKTGFVYVVNSKIAPESDVGVTAMLGYDPYEYYTGRGPLEAYGIKLKIAPGDLALRCNFGSIIDHRLVDRRVGRTFTTREAKILEKAINEEIQFDYPFEFKATIGHRGVLVIRGSFSSNISNVDPAYKKEGMFGSAVSGNKLIMNKCEALENNKKANLSAEVVNDFVRKSYKLLNEHPLNKERLQKLLLPANIILTRDAGVQLPNFPRKKGEWGAVVGMPLEKGIARLAGMKILKVDYPEIITKDRYKNVHKDLITELNMSKRYLKQGYFENYYIHIKQTDIPGHDGDAIIKKKMIEIIDAGLFKFIRKKGFEVAVTADHSTPCELKAHSSDPVPLLWSNNEGDGSERFTENECKKGSLGKLYGKDVLKTIGFE